MTGILEKSGADMASALDESASPTTSIAKRTPRVRMVDIVFTPEQIAYLDERMRIVTEVRPMRRAGGSSLRQRHREGLLAT